MQERKHDSFQVQYLVAKCLIAFHWHTFLTRSLIVGEKSLSEKSLYSLQKKKNLDQMSYFTYP